MALKEILPVYHVITDAQMINAVPITSALSNIIYKDSVAYQYIWTGTPTGTFTIDGSLNYSPGLPQGGGPANSGTWTSITLSPTPGTSGTAGNLLINLNQLSFPWIRTTFTSTALAAQTIALVADVAGSLNSKYFLLNSGNNASLYYVWFNINSAGVDPLIAGRTAVPITGATNASAATLGASLATAIAALNSSAEFSTSGTSTVTVTALVAGPMLPASDGTAATGFTFTATTGSGVLNAYIAGKSLG